MDEEAVLEEARASEYSQLIQVRVPLTQAADAFAMRDASGRIPIVVIPKQLNRVRNEFVALGLLILIGGIVATAFLNAPWSLGLAIPVAIVLLVLGLYRAFVVRIPEGVNALLMRGGRYLKTIGSGTHIIAPYIVVSHLVTRREIPFDVPVVEVPTNDNVRASIDTLFTFRIVDPYKFVYSISADDFDQVFQAACQNELRKHVRQIGVQQVMDLVQQDLAPLREALNGEMDAYGVTISKSTVVFAQPPAEFMRSLEARQLAIVQQAEQAEAQALAQRRQRDTEALLHQEVLARVARQREELAVKFQEAEARRRVIELEAETEALRLAELEARLAANPLAAQYEWESLQLEVARALAGNTRAILQVGDAGDITRAFVLGDLMKFTAPKDAAQIPTRATAVNSPPNTSAAEHPPPEPHPVQSELVKDPINPTEVPL